MKLSEKITFLRKKEGMSQENLAEKLSVSRQSIYKWEIGECMPSWEKIKLISKLFNVSFDYLMDDSIEEISIDTNTNKFHNAPRRAYSTNIKLKYNQADIDNGYTEGRKTNVKDIGCVENNKANAQSELKKLNIFDYYLIQNLAATYFFYDSKNKSCGFFYAGMVQFVCPIENILNFTYGGGNHRVVNSRTAIGGFGFNNDGLSSVGVGFVPSLSAVADTTAWAVLSYKQGNTVEQFELNFSVMNNFLDNLGNRPAEDLDRFWMLQMDILLKSLEKLNSKIISLQKIGQDIREGNIKVEPINYDRFKQTNARLKEKQDLYLRALRDATIQENKKRTKIKIWVGVIIAIVVLCVGYFLLVNGFFDMNRPTYYLY